MRFSVKSTQRNLLRQWSDAIVQGRLTAAFDLAERLLDVGATTEVYEQLLRPDRLIVSGDHLRMYDLLQHLEQDGRSAQGPWGLMLRVALLERLGWYDEAVSISADFKNLPRRYGWMCYARALMLMNHRQAYNEARTEVEIALQASPNLWKARGTLAECALCQGSETEAIAIMDDCVARLGISGQPGEKDDAIIWRGELRLWLGQCPAAVADLESAVARKVPYALIWSGAAHLLLGDHGRALALLDEAMKMVPSDSEAYVWRGEAYERLGDAERAIEDFDNSLRFSPMLVWPLVGRALTNARRGNPAATILDFKALPARITAFFEWKAGTRVGDDANAATTVLLKMREAARGLRRTEQYLEVLWMKRT